jgi:DNA-binding Lrp family transcriptional regulator
MTDEALRMALLNDWQRDFPLVREPFGVIARAAGTDAATVLRTYRALSAEGAISRIGGVFDGRAGGSAMLCAMAVPAPLLDAVAALVSAHPGVNHNYEREHRYNLWFVITGRDDDTVRRGVAGLEADIGLRALRLRMRRAYRIDLGFDLRGSHAGAQAQRRHDDAAPVDDDDLGLAALVEDGLPLQRRPFDPWAEALGRPLPQVLATLQRWLHEGTLRRLGVIVRHHELGFGANAMTVFDVPDEQVDRCGRSLAAQPGITLAYRRERDSGWPYNLYCMVHGRDREAVRSMIENATMASGLDGYDQAVLFSRRRFKQIGARRFRDLPEPQHAVA